MKKLGPMIGVLVLLAFGAWHLTGSGRDSGTRGPTLVDPARTEGRELVAGDETADVGAAKLAPSTVGLADDRSAPTSALDDLPAHERVIRGLVLDALTDLPVAGAEIEVLQRIHEEFNVLDLEHAKDARPVGTTLSGADGRFEVPARPDVPFELTARRLPYASAHREFVFAGDELELRLTPGAVFTGRVTRAADGTGVADVPLRGWDEERVHVFEGTTDAAGDFRFDGLEAGLVTVAVTPATVERPAWQKVDLERGKVHRLDFALPDGVTIFGTITDATSGRPVAGAEIGEGWTFEKRVRSGPGGAYELHAFGGPGVYDVHVRAPGYASAQHAFEPGAMPVEDRKLDFALQPAAGAAGRVVDDEGEPLEGVYCAAVASSFVDGDQHTDYEGTYSDADGAFAFHSLDRTLPHQLLLRKAGFGTRLYDFPDAERTSRRLSLGEFVLGAPGAIRGTLVDEHGAPLVGHAVSLKGLNADAALLRPGAEDTKATRYTDTRSSRTDGRGRFRFADLPGGRFTVRARVPGNRLVETSLEVELAEGQVAADLELVLALGGAVRGRVVGPDGRPRTDVRVVVSAADGAPVLGVSAQSGSDGRFELLGLDAEEVLLACDPSTFNWRGAGERLAAGAPVQVTVGSDDVELVVHPAAVLRVKVVDAAGDPVASRTLVARAEGGDHPLASEWTGPDGVAAMLVPADGRYDVAAESAYAHFATDAPATPVPTLLGLEPGGEVHVLELP